MKKNCNLRLLLLLLLPLMLLSCHREMVVNPIESTKLLNGTWKITKALRNGTDLTSRFDFSGFKIVFQDSTYTLDSLVPFPVSENGAFHLDDPKYPFKLFLKAGTSEYKELNMEYPISGGVRNIIISFSPGCSSNTYQYTLQKVN